MWFINTLFNYVNAQVSDEYVHKLSDLSFRSSQDPWQVLNSDLPPSKRGDSELQDGFYLKSLAQFLAEIWPFSYYFREKIATAF